MITFSVFRKSMLFFLKIIIVSDFCLNFYVFNGSPTTNFSPIV